MGVGGDGVRLHQLAFAGEVPLPDIEGLARGEAGDGELFVVVLAVEEEDGDAVAGAALQGGDPDVLDGAVDFQCTPAGMRVVGEELEEGVAGF